MEQQQGELVQIPRAGRLWACNAYLPLTGEWGFVVLYPGGLGWRSGLCAGALDFFFITSPQYHLIPVSRIREVSLKRGCYFSTNRLHVVWQTKDAKPSTFEAEVVFPQYWVPRLKELGIPVVGAHPVDSWRILGFWNNYSSVVLMLLVFFAVYTTMTLPDYKDRVRTGFTWAGVISAIAVVGAVLLTRRAIREVEAGKVGNQKGAILEMKEERRSLYAPR